MPDNPAKAPQKPRKKRRQYPKRKQLHVKRLRLQITESGKKKALAEKYSRDITQLQQIADSGADVTAEMIYQAGFAAGIEYAAEVAEIANWTHRESVYQIQLRQKQQAGNYKRTRYQHLYNTEAKKQHYRIYRRTDYRAVRKALRLKRHELAKLCRVPFAQYMHIEYKDVVVPDPVYLIRINNKLSELVKREI